MTQIADVIDAERDALMLALAKLPELSDWDEQAVKILLEEITIADPDLLDLSGFETAEIDIITETATEDRPAGSDFLAGVCERWEQEAMRAAGPRTRVACMRTGIVLEKDGGALPQMLPPFWFGAGGPVGSGRQYWPWIHRHDWIALVRWAIATPAANGALNATAPHPVTNAEFARALGRALHRPAFLPAPGFALRLLLGEMADALLLSGQNAVPAKAARGGFQFRYANVDQALGAIFARA